MPRTAPQAYHDALAAIHAAIRPGSLPQTGIVLGTGLGEWVERLRGVSAISYTDIPGFPQSTVETHTGRLVYAEIGDIPVWILQGRFHLYEGYGPEEVCTGIRILGMLGVKRLILTNASGAINPDFTTGNVMVISDQLNMTGENPLRGANVEEWGPRFPDMSAVYEPSLQAAALQAAVDCGLRPERGTYVGVLGPSLETPAETRAFRLMGGDAVGMSTVVEAIAARHMGLEVLGLSCLTNKNLPDCMEQTSFQAIVEQAERTGRDLGRLLETLVPRL